MSKPILIIGKIGSDRTVNDDFNCPECDTPWNIDENRCSANCQAIDRFDHESV